MADTEQQLKQEMEEAKRDILEKKAAVCFSCFFLSFVLVISVDTCTHIHIHTYKHFKHKQREAELLKEQEEIKNKLVAERNKAEQNLQSEKDALERDKEELERQLKEVHETLKVNVEKFFVKKLFSQYTSCYI